LSIELPGANGFERYTGRLVTVASSDPAAGAEISVTVPARTIYKLVGARVALVTDATVSNRTVQLTVDDGTTVFNLFPSPSTQAASLTYNYNFTAGANNATVLNNNVVVGIGQDLLLPSTYRIRTLTNNIQAGDNFGIMTLFVLRYTF
jgi:hypothetical protein